MAARVGDKKWYRHYPCLEWKDSQVELIINNKEDKNAYYMHK